MNSSDSEPAISRPDLVKDIFSAYELLSTEKCKSYLTICCCNLSVLNPVSNWLLARRDEVSDACLIQIKTMYQLFI